MVFGRVVAGQDVVDELESTRTDTKDCPLQPAKISNCGELVRVSRKRETSTESQQTKQKVKKDKKKKSKSKRREFDSLPKNDNESDGTEPDGTQSNTRKLEEIDEPKQYRFLDRDAEPAGNKRRNSRNSNGRHAASERDHKRRDSRDDDRDGPRTDKQGRIVKGRGSLKYRPY